MTHRAALRTLALAGVLAGLASPLTLHAQLRSTTCAPPQRTALNNTYGTWRNSGWEMIAKTGGVEFWVKVDDAQYQTRLVNSNCYNVVVGSRETLVMRNGATFARSKDCAITAVAPGMARDFESTYVLDGYNGRALFTDANPLTHVQVNLAATPTGKENGRFWGSQFDPCAG